MRSLITTILKLKCEWLQRKFRWILLQQLVVSRQLKRSFCLQLQRPQSHCAMISSSLKSCIILHFLQSIYPNEVTEGVKYIDFTLQNSKLHNFWLCPACANNAGPSWTSEQDRYQRGLLESFQLLHRTTERSNSSSLSRPRAAHTAKI